MSGYFTSLPLPFSFVLQKFPLDYLALFRNFSAMDKALPKPEALRFARDLKQFSFISQVARNRYRDEKLSLRDASKKVRDIVDEFLVSKGVDPKIPPVPIFAEKLKFKIEQQSSPRARAEEIKSAVGEHISRHLEEDPELYERFSEKLEKLLRDYQYNCPDGLATAAGAEAPALMFNRWLWLRGG